MSFYKNSFKAYENPVYILDICPEQGLSSQKYRCAECRTKLCIESNAKRLKNAPVYKFTAMFLDDKQQFPAPRQCDYTGKYFCPTCQWTDEVPIPARIVNNWDFEPRPVKSCLIQFLTHFH